MSDKVILRDHRQTTKVLLPSTGITVEIYPSLLMSDLDDLNLNELSAGSIVQTKRMFVKLIKSWNAYAKEEDTEPMPITEETVGLIHSDDIPVMTTAIEKFQKEQKKN